MDTRVSADGGGRAGHHLRFGALAFALLIHAAFGYVLVTGGDGDGKPSPKTLSLRLVPSGWNVPANPSVPREPLSVQRSLPAAAESAPMASVSAKQDKARISVTQPVGPHYFRMSELTQKPVLVSDVASNLILHVPGLPPQPVILRLLISDEGEVDRVVVEDSFLAADIERDVTEAFAKVRFEPGRIGRIAVRSQMRVEARLESMEYRVSNGPGVGG